MSANPQPGDLQRDDRDVWPDDVPVGIFQIERGGAQGYPGATAHIQFVCPSGRRCAILLGPQFVPRPAPDALCVWAWDGDEDRPTITPSINCVAEKDGQPAGGCGWHGYITQGRFQ